MTTIRVDAPAFRDLLIAAARSLEEINSVAIDSWTLTDLHAIVERWHPEVAVRLHLSDFRKEVIHD